MTRMLKVKEKYFMTEYKALYVLFKYLLYDLIFGKLQLKFRQNKNCYYGVVNFHTGLW
jgi:hypothetical protein